jgi:hypothetical protein
MTQDQYVLIGLASSALVLFVILMLLFLRFQARRASSRKVKGRVSTKPRSVEPARGQSLKDRPAAPPPPSSTAYSPELGGNSVNASPRGGRASAKSPGDLAAGQTRANWQSSTDQLELGNDASLVARVDQASEFSVGILSAVSTGEEVGGPSQQTARPHGHDAFVPQYVSDAWETRWSTKTVATFGNDSLKLPPAEHALSGAIPTTPGDVWECEFKATPVSASTNGGAINFYIGPVIRSAEGKLLTWWQEQKPFNEGEISRSGRVIATSPDGAVSVHIGMLSSFYEPPKVAANVEIVFSQLKLRRVSAS